MISRAISEAILVNLNKKHGCRVTGLHPSTLERFQAHSWPGNIRELRNILERAVIMASEGLILPKHVAMDSNATLEPHPSASPPTPHDESAASERNPGKEQSAADEQSEQMEALRIRPGASMEEIEETYIDLIVQRTNNNKTRAAEILGISVRTLHNRLGQLGKIAGDKLRATALQDKPSGGRKGKCAESASFRARGYLYRSAMVLDDFAAQGEAEPRPPVLSALNPHERLKTASQSAGSIPDPVVRHLNRPLARLPAAQAETAISGGALRNGIEVSCRSRSRTLHQTLQTYGYSGLWIVFRRLGAAQRYAGDRCALSVDVITRVARVMLKADCRDAPSAAGESDVRNALEYAETPSISPRIRVAPARISPTTSSPSVPSRPFAISWSNSENALIVRRGSLRSWTSRSEIRPGFFREVPIAAGNLSLRRCLDRLAGSRSFGHQAFSPTQTEPKRHLS